MRVRGAPRGAQRLGQHSRVGTHRDTLDIITPGKPQPWHHREQCRGLPAAPRAISIGKMLYLPSHPTLINCFN